MSQGLPFDNYWPAWSMNKFDVDMIDSTDVQQNQHNSFQKLVTGNPELKTSAKENSTGSTTSQEDLDLDSYYVYHVVHNTEAENNYKGNISNFSDLERMPRDSDNNDNFEEPYERLKAEYGSWKNLGTIERFNLISFVFLLVPIIF